MVVTNIEDEARKAGNLFNLVHLEMESNPRYSQKGTKIKMYIDAGELARGRRNYNLASHCFSCASWLLNKANLKLLSQKYMNMAGDAYAKAGGSYYDQEAGFAYGYAANSSKLEEHLKNLGYEEADIHPSTWMAHARFLVRDRAGDYQYGR